MGSSGVGIVLGYTLLYLGGIVLVPLAALSARALHLSAHDLLAVATSPRVLASCEVTFGTSLLAAGVNALFGLIIAWVLVRYDFWGRRVLDAVVDLPFALPTAVAGIALTALFTEQGWLGAPLSTLGVKVAFTPLGIMVALIFIGLPFVVRTLQPVLEDLDPDVEEAATCLGASRAQVFRRVILPEIAPALISGSALAFARGLGEYGSVVFISGNMPMKTEVVPLLIVTKLEQYDYAGATAIAALMLVSSFAVLLCINGVQVLRRRLRAEIVELPR
jgi:sulfate transport system permease protein